MSQQIETQLNRRKLLQLGGSAAALGMLAGCLGDDASEEYPADDIRFIVPYGPGGGFDTYARGLGDHMPEHLDAEINVDNVEGAGGRTGANEVYRADPDGYTIGLFNVPGMIATQLVEETEYNLNEVSWVGRIGAEPYMILVGSDTDYETVEDLQEADEPIRFAQTGAGATSWLVDVIATQAMEIERNHVMGYDGSQGMITAVLRGEAEAMSMVYQAVQPQVEDGELRPIVALADEPPDFAPDTPTAAEVGYDDLADLGLHYPIGGPPGVDENRIEILEEALLETADSDEMTEWGEEVSLPIEPLGSQETGELINNMGDLIEQYQDLLEQEME